ncbi:gluconokinase [Ramlibacter sp.]|uniref:gluconokinase n=1 Tax=Ramlibacter sp. TaxID=1917967 RepID=UPI002FCAA0FA
MAATDSSRQHPNPGRGLRAVVMGVAGCGKSAVGRRLAEALRLPLVEGDAFHAPSSLDKMRRGVPLDDADRAGWLAALAAELANRPEGVVLTCSALKARYREQLRAAAPGLRFVQLALTPAQARERVAARTGHFYPAGLVASQFEALEDPAGEPGVRVVDAAQPLDAVVQQALEGLRRG